MRVTIFLSALIVTGLASMFFDTWILEYITSFLPYVICVYSIVALVILSKIIRSKKKSIISLILIVGVVILVLYWMLAISSFYTPYAQRLNESSITMLYANIHHQNTDYRELEAFITSNNPDIVLFVEFSDHHRVAMGDFLQETYPYSSIDFDTPLRYSRNVVFSTVATNTIQERTIGHKKHTLSISDSETLTLFSVHTTAPVNPDYFNRRNTQLDNLLTDTQDCTKHCILAGDFNVSPWSPHYQQFETSLGNNYFNTTRYLNSLFTWRLKSLPMIRSHIDHIFVSNDISVQNINKFSLNGSDHDGLVIRFRL